MLSIEDIASQEPELELAPEIIYWVSAKFAAELIVKHRYYPDMKINERSSLYSYWRMLADKSEDNERFSILREGMPLLAGRFPLISSVNKPIVKPPMKALAKPLENSLKNYRCQGSGKVLGRIYKLDY